MRAPPSLTARLAWLFAVLSLVLLGSVGYGLYNGLETQLALRDDAAVVTRAEQIRALLQEAGTMELVLEKPQLFQNMLGNREGVLVLSTPGKKPLLEVNPGALPIPAPAPVPAGSPVTLAAVQRSIGPGGMPFSSVAVDVQGAEGEGMLRITAGRLMAERSRILDGYRKLIIVLVAIGSAAATVAAFALTARGMRPLKSLADQTAAISVSNLAARIDARAAPAELAPLIGAFNAMLERLQSGFEQVGAVSSDMAHDLRTPINNLLGQTEVALSQARSGEYYQDLLASNLEELQRLSRMTDNMLFLARADHAGAMIEPALLDVDGEFARMADYFEGIADERGLRIECRSSSAMQLWADPLLLRRALANLINNAIQYADPDGAIVLSAAAEGAGVCLAVENHGPAIAPAQLARLFERFYRADTARRGSAQSSGLGLSIVRTIMHLHGGKAEAASSGGINRFTLFFPRSTQTSTQK